MEIRVDIKRVDIKNSNEQIVEFVVGQSETVLNINIWPNFVDQFTIALIDSSNNRTQNFQLIIMKFPII